MDFIEDALTKYKLKKRDLLEALLISEEVLIQLSEKAIEDSTIQVTVKKWLGVPRIKFISSGDAIDIGDQATVVSLNELDNSEDSIRNMMLHSFADSIRYQHTKSTFYCPFRLWQYSSAGQVAGVQGNVDLDVWME